MPDNTSVVEGNKLIAEFDGIKIGVSLYSWRQGCTEPIEERHLNYHASWGWLMPVVEKIGQIELGNQKDEATGRIMPYYAHVYTLRDNMTRIHCFQVFTGETQIESTWLAVVDFIKWYKDQPLIPRTETAWIAAVDNDSFNYVPKRIEQKQFNEATCAGYDLYDTDDNCQKECDRLNSL